MVWILFIIGIDGLAQGKPPMIGAYPPVATMTECFEKRESVIQELGRPLINYQAVCIRYDAEGDSI